MIFNTERLPVLH